MTTQEHPLQERVENALKSIRGYLQTDGGDVRIVSITPENIVELELMGACSSCSMSAMTMKAGVEGAILRSVPEVAGIRTTGMQTA
jgi:Fe-S cluster biogenesis protein NfuA